MNNLALIDRLIELYDNFTQMRRETTGHYALSLMAAINYINYMIPAIEESDSETDVYLADGIWRWDHRDVVKNMEYVGYSWNELKKLMNNPWN